MKAKPVISMELISLHVPKCAGSSLRSALVRVYGEDQIYFDNNDRLLDPKSPVNIHRENFIQQFKLNRDEILAAKRVAHGHFCLQKYDGIQAPRVTILRNPVDRLISHYLFWQHLPPHGHSLHDQFLATNPSLIEFARMPAMRHFYNQVLFRDVDMNTFDLIGIVEKMKETIAALEKLTGRSFQLEKDNENSCDHCRQKKTEFAGIADLQAELRDILKEDIIFYERHAMRI
jgi:hypothetical protein